MKVAELRAQGWTAIQGDALTNDLSERIVLSFNGAFAVNNGHHDELEIVDLLWRKKSKSEERGYSGATEFSKEGWRPDLCSTSNAAKQYKDDTQCFGEDVLKVKVPSDRMKEALKEADAISESFLSSRVDVPAEPIFTQAMADAGEFPHVGSKFMMGGWKEACVMTAVGRVNILFDYCGIEYVREIENIKFSPFDDRTEKQKAVDIANKEFLVDKPTLEAIYDLWRQTVEQQEKRSRLP